MEPGWIPYCRAYFLISAALATPFGQSHWTCSAIVGQIPVSRCTWPASLNFSSTFVAAAGWMNFPKRVPVLANPQEGSSIRNVSSAWKIESVWREFMSRPRVFLRAYTSAPRPPATLRDIDDISQCETYRDYREWPE